MADPRAARARPPASAGRSSVQERLDASSLTPGHMRAVANALALMSPANQGTRFAGSVRDSASTTLARAPRHHSMTSCGRSFLPSRAPAMVKASGDS